MGPSTTTRPRAAVAGLLAAAVALGVGELVAGLARPFVSPLEAVAEKVIDLAPGPVERFAIETFGSNDKLVLVVGAIVTALVLGATLGIVARHRFGAAAGGIGAFGVLGILANLAGVGGIVGAVPSFVAIPAGIVVLTVLVRGAGGHSRVSAPADGPARRRFLRLSGMAAVAGAAFAATGRALAGRFSAEASRAAVVLPPPVNASPPLPESVSVGVDGVAPFVTPFEQFYRVDTALTVPQVPTEDWRLRIHGLVDRELELSYEDLLARDLRDEDITLTCVSNTVGGDLVGHARWRGVRLRDLLDEVGVEEEADQVVGRSVDDYTCGFPVEAAYDREAMVVVGMNGEPLPIERGFPARLIVPGLYGYVSATKWLSEIELTTFAAFDQYWIPRGWDEQAPIKTQCRIDTPRPVQSLAAGRVTIAGVAWAQTRGISRVEVRIDDGPFEDAILAEELNETSWRQWKHDWDATPGSHRITVRATDGDGALQTDQRAEPFPDGASGWMSLLVTVNG